MSGAKTNMSLLKDGLQALLEKLRGSPSELKEFQKETAVHLLAGQNVILTAPTGAGKTWAALLPFLYSREKGALFTDRLIYALPLRSLASDLFRSTKEACSKVGFNDIEVTLQTGDNCNDSFFKGDIIFTTIDQLLSGYLNIPLSLPLKLSNINAGASLGSLIVFDEVHLLEPGRSLATVLEMVDRLHKYAIFLMMTATLSREAIDILGEQLKATKVMVEKEDLSKLPSHADKERRYRWTGESLSAEAVLNTHDKGRSIVVCNTVTNAQFMYEEIMQKKDGSTNVFLLHSRFFPEDRRKQEEKLSKFFGPHANETDAILVATQAIEAGLDISADNLHTVLCPANALIQRAGRCARYAGLRGRGTVWIYDLEKNQSGMEKLGPYRERGNASLIVATREAFKTLEEKILNFPEEQKLVNEVHETTEKLILTEDVIPSLSKRREQVNTALRHGDRSSISELIRDVDSVNIFIHDNPVSIDFNEPWQYLSLPRVSLWSLKHFFGSPSDRWIAQVPTKEPIEDDEPGIRLNWKTVSSIEEMYSSWLICLHPSIAAYKKDRGLILGQDGEPVQHPLRPKREMTFQPEYFCETFIQHAVAVIKQCCFQENRYRRTAQQLEKNLALPEGMVEHLARIVAALHDTGKLGVRWQKAIRSWQNDRDPLNPVFCTGQPLAHSTYSYRTDYFLSKDKKYDKGPHACEGAYAVANALNALLEVFSGQLSADVVSGVAVAACSAIARHHGGRTSRLSEFKLIEEACRYLNPALLKAGIVFELRKSQINHNPKRRDIDNFAMELINEENSDDAPFIPLYWFLVRRLRLADQAAMACQKGGEIIVNCNKSS
ncbi:MAG: CRISPR-associated helicase Cas3' [Peptococcaceae bacterium]|nr:MAG: CRISPR-associated helicase Cas3' [Peptococcaceae bacterium]